jgi:hypothetical protein
LQRFGSPATGNTTTTKAHHFFGLDPALEPGPLSAMHNLHYQRTQASDGTVAETVTIFGNTMVGINVSQVFTFDLRLTPQQTSHTTNEGDPPQRSVVGEKSDATSDGSPFATNYRKCELAYHEETWGGARLLGESVWLVGRDDIAAFDSSSPSPAAGSSTANFSVYDPFISVCVQGCTTWD